MSNIAIKAENLSKAYQLGDIGTGTISRDLERWYARIRGKEDPFLRIGETNDRSTKGSSDVVWSLKDVNFEIQQGDAVGIIGRNGAGKSTLLKILSKVTAPTSGKITGKGRIASLLEVGTGFHPELSGRENIFLNGAILGMRKKEIARKLDEIVDFAGIERYLDTPVKRYSSGMYVRLAFAVAAHLESEILIVDEVLAVGDAEFQKKCLGKMGDISKGEGRTVLFVSHNMAAIKNLCYNSILLSNGNLKMMGNSDTIIENYLYNDTEKLNKYDYDIENLSKLYTFEDEVFKVNQIRVCKKGDCNNFKVSYTKDENIFFLIHYKVKVETVGLRVGFELRDDNEIVIFRSFHDDLLNEVSHFKAGEYKSECYIPKNTLKDNSIYKIYLAIGIHEVRWIHYNDFHFIINTEKAYDPYVEQKSGLLSINLNWTTKKTNNEC